MQKKKKCRQNAFFFFSRNVYSHMYKHIAKKNYSPSVGASCPFFQITNFKAKNYLILVKNGPKMLAPKGPKKGYNLQKDISVYCFFLFCNWS